MDNPALETLGGRQKPSNRTYCTLRRKPNTQAFSPGKHQLEGPVEHLVNPNEPVCRIFNTG